MLNQERTHLEYVRHMRLRRRQMLKAAAAGGSIGLMAFIAACAPAAAPPSPTTAPAASGQPTATAGAAAPAATKAPAPTVVPAAMADALHLNLGNEPDTMDPGRASFIGEIEVVMRVFSNSYTFDSKAQLVLDQAEAMPAVSADGKTVTVKLKKGLVWSDGKPLLAKDFVYGALRQLNPAVAGDYAFTLYGLVGAMDYNKADPKKATSDDLKKLRDAVGVSAPDDTTLVYKLVEPAPWFLSVLATWNGLPVREDLVTNGGKDPEDNQDWTGDPKRYIGNGPYVLAKHGANVQFVFTSNSKYVRGEPPVKTVQLFMIKDNTVAFNAYKAGDLDRTTVGPLIKDAVDKDPVLTKEFTRTPGHCNFYVGFNNTIAPFDNVKVRQAFSAAIDRNALSNQVFKGLTLPADQFLPMGFPGHYDDIPAQKLDAAAGKQLLADAGFADGKGLPAIKFTFSNTDTNKLISQAVQAMFKSNLGVDVVLDPVEPKAFTALTKKQETTPQLFRLGWCQDYPDPQDWYSTVFQGGATVSHTGWKNADFDKLTRAADVELDPKKRDDLYRQAAVILNTETPVAFIYFDTSPFLIKPRVQGMKVDPFEFFIGQHSLYDLKIAM